MKHILATACAFAALASCAPPPSPDILLASEQTRLNITASAANAQLAIDCSGEIGGLVERFRSRVGDGNAFGALYVGYDSAAGTCSDHAIARNTHSVIDAANLAEAVCKRRNDGNACYEIAVAVPSNFREDMITMSQELSAEIRDSYLNATGFAAIAVSATGAYGVATGEASAESARTSALNACKDRVASGFDSNRARYINPALVVNANCRTLTERNADGTDSVPITQ